MMPFDVVSSPDPTVAEAARAAIGASAGEFGLGAGSLGEVAEVGAWLAACQGVELPRSVERAVLAIVAGERPGLPAEASTLPAGAAAALAEKMERGNSPIYSSASAQGVVVDFIDASPATHFLELTGESSVESSENSDWKGLTEEEFDAALQRGKKFADTEADKGTELILLGDYGRGATTTASAIIGAICSIEPVKVIGWGSGIDDEGWKAKVALIRDDIFSVRADRGDVPRVLRAIGTPDISVMAGILGQAAVRRTPVIFDGVAATAAALCAQVMAPGASDWWRPAAKGTEPAMLPALSALQLSPIADFGVGTGQGANTLMVLPLLRLAAELGSTPK